MTLTISKHALARCVDMALDGDEIRAAFDKPRSCARSETTGATYMTRGRITLVVSDDDNVITVLWATAAAFVADQSIGSYDHRDGSQLGKNRAVARVRKGKKR